MLPDGVRNYFFLHVNKRQRNTRRQYQAWNEYGKYATHSSNMLDLAAYLLQQVSCDNAKYIIIVIIIIFILAQENRGAAER